MSRATVGTRDACPYQTCICAQSADLHDSRMCPLFKNLSNYGCNPCAGYVMLRSMRPPSQIGTWPFAAEAAPRRTHVERALYAPPQMGGGGQTFSLKERVRGRFSASHAVLDCGWPRWVPAPSFRAFQQRRNAPAERRDKFCTQIIALQFCRDRILASKHANFCRKHQGKYESSNLQPN